MLDILNDPAITSIGRIPHGVQLHSCSGQCACLNGDWQFRYESSILGIREDWFTDTADDSVWGHIPVPGQWQLNGYGAPQYLNTRYAFQPERDVRS